MNQTPQTNTAIAAMGMIFLLTIMTAPAGCVAPDALQAPVDVQAPIASPTGQLASQSAASQPIAQETQSSAIVSTQSPTATSVGAQSGSVGTSGWTINVGSLELGGSTIAILTIAATIVLLARRGNAFKATTDVLVTKIDTLALPKLDRLDIAAKASAAGVSQALAKRIGAVRAQAAQSPMCRTSKNQTLNNVNEQTPITEREKND
jgi:hypothetical protein